MLDSQSFSLYTNVTANAEKNKISLNKVSIKIQKIQYVKFHFISINAHFLAKFKS